MRLMIGLLLMLGTQAYAAEPRLAPYDNRYEMEWGRFSIGDGQITLAPTAQKDCYRYESKTALVGLVRAIVGEPHELSLFCVRKGIIRTSHYAYSIEDESEDNYAMDFDWARRSVVTRKNGNTTTRKLPDAAYDRFVVREVVRQWVRSKAGKLKPGDTFDLKMMDDDSLNDYRFAFVGEETVETPAGPFRALRVDRINNPSKILRAWIAPERDYTVVVLEQIRNGKRDFRLRLSQN